MLKRLIPLLCLLVIAILPTSQAAEIPQLESGATLSGKPTLAQFFGGASTDAGASFGHQFNPNQPLQVVGEIAIEPAHVGSMGNIYTIALLGQQAFMQDSSGNFQPWNLDVSTLVPFRENQVLSASESLQPINNLALGPFGIENASLSFHYAYSTDTDPGELFFNQSPLQLSIDAYDPLVNIFGQAKTIDTLVEDASRSREIPILIYLAENTGPAPTVLFSHGLGGDRFTVIYLAEQWSQRGFNVINLQHPGSDSSILENVPLTELAAAFEAAASLENSIARVEDVTAVLNQLEIWNADMDSELFNRIDFDHIGMSGHSFGARTTQNVSGQVSFTIPGETRDPRIDASVIFSPSPPGLGDTQAAFAAVDIPWMLMTGTLDESSVSDVSPQERLLVYPALPPGGKYELVLFNGEHHAFTDRALGQAQNPRNPAHHPEIQALSTAFWEAWLLNDNSARAWLDGSGAESTLQPGDTWQLK